MVLSIFLYVIMFALINIIFSLSINYENEGILQWGYSYFFDIFLNLIFTVFLIYFYELVNIESAYEYFVYTLLFSTLFALSIIDYKYGILPDKINFLAFFVALLIVGYEAFCNKMTHLNIDTTDRLIAVIALIIIVGLLVVTKSEDKIGGGDIKLLLWISLALGWKYVFIGLMTACILALICHFLTHLIKRSESNEIRFGPFLSIGFVIAVCNGDYLFNQYLVLAGIL